MRRVAQEGDLGCAAAGTQPPHERRLRKDAGGPADERVRLMRAGFQKVGAGAGGKPAAKDVIWSRVRTPHNRRHARSQHTARAMGSSPTCHTLDPANPLLRPGRKFDSRDARAVAAHLGVADETVHVVELWEAAAEELRQLGAALKSPDLVRRRLDHVGGARPAPLGVRDVVRVKSGALAEQGLEGLKARELRASSSRLVGSGVV